MTWALIAAGVLGVITGGVGAAIWILRILSKGFRW